MLLMCEFMRVFDLHAHQLMILDDEPLQVLDGPLVFLVSNMLSGICMMLS